MKPANEQIAGGKSHEYTRENGYTETEHVHREYPKYVGGLLVQSAEEEASLEAKAAEARAAADKAAEAVDDAKANADAADATAEQLEAAAKAAAVDAATA